MKTISRFFLVLISLFITVLLVIRFSEVSLPGFVIERIADSFSSDNLLLRIDCVQWSFPGKLKIKGLRVIDRKKAEAKPFISAESITARLSFSHFPLKPGNIVRSVTVTKLKMPRLPDGYYIPDSIEFPGSNDFAETDNPLELDIPDFAPFSLTLIEPEILDLHATTASVKNVFARNRVLKFDDVTVAFPDRDVRMSVTGDCELNIPEQKIVGSVHGQARQHNIRPMLQALDISNSYQFIDAFTGVHTPVDAGCKFEVNLRNNDLRIFLDLNPTGGAYRDVPLKTVQGNIDIRVFVRERFQNALISVGPVDARLADGSFMTGSVIYENTNDVGYVTFRNVRSTTSLSNALAVADILTDGTLDCLQPDTPPSITIEGTMAVDSAHAATNRLDGSIAFERGSLFGIPFRKAAAEFQVRGERINFSDAHASMPRGGAVNGEGDISFPGFKEKNASFKVAVKADDIALDDALGALKIKSGDMHGRVSGTLEFSGPLSTALISRVNGKASISLKNGHLARLNVFAGLTDYLAKNIPGISSLVDQSDAQIECTIENGVIKASRIHVSGDVFSITGSGTYSMPKDEIDITARVRIFRNDSILGQIANPITWTFSKLLMEFRVYGSIDNPKWKYISVIERLL